MVQLQKYMSLPAGFGEYTFQKQTISRERNLKFPSIYIVYVYVFFFFLTHLLSFLELG
jgi:hypothetical protein